MCFIYTMEYYSALKRKEVLTHATKWVKLEDLILSEISQTQNEKCHGVPLLRCLWYSNS